jgi:hypothetical protein
VGTDLPQVYREQQVKTAVRLTLGLDQMSQGLQIRFLGSHQVIQKQPQVWIPHSKVGCHSDCSCPGKKLWAQGARHLHGRLGLGVVSLQSAPGAWGSAPGHKKATDDCAQRSGRRKWMMRIRPHLTQGSF